MGEIEAEDGKKAFIGGLPWETDDDRLKKWIVNETKLNDKNIVSIKIPTWYDSGRCKGYAIVVFDSESSLIECMTADKKKMGERYLDIQKSTSNSTDKPKKRKIQDIESIPDECKLLFVKNLPYETTEDLVKQKFEKFGEVESVRLGRWNNTGRLKGFGYVAFKTTKGLKKAYKKDSITLAGRDLILDFETNSQPKNSFRDSKGKHWYKKKRET